MTVAQAQNPEAIDNHYNAFRLGLKRVFQKLGTAGKTSSTIFWLCP
jgi:hypothetical protein